MSFSLGKIFSVLLFQKQTADCHKNVNIKSLFSFWEIIWSNRWLEKEKKYVGPDLKNS